MIKFPYRPWAPAPIALCSSLGSGIFPSPHWKNILASLGRWRTSTSRCQCMAGGIDFILAVVFQIRYPEARLHYHYQIISCSFRNDNFGFVRFTEEASALNALKNSWHTVDDEEIGIKPHKDSQLAKNSNTSRWISTSSHDLWHRLIDNGLISLWP